ncbi:MAG: hypothetical protein H0W65_03425 [Sphingomonas sp.]|uniref:hypothetical protein n=1 Tax=Sphingomonas sp. TaxID=28214 RepID=UPI0017FCBEC9|nr:hypothetical protein [Sphingomonas sp.]MBA3666759.1 hypothetical protein [Sphingomonas sp.]
MTKLLPIAPFALAMLLLACGTADPVADNAAAPNDELLGDAAASGLAAPANAAAAERATQAVTPPSTDGMMWSFRGTDRTALYGAAGAEPALSVQCRKVADDGKELLIVRGTAAPDGASGTLSFTGNGIAASLPVRGVALTAGKGRWQAAIAPGDTARAVARTFAGQGVVQVGVTGGDSLSVHASPEAKMVFAECLGGPVAAR